MMNVLYLQARIFPLYQTAIGRAALVQSIVGDRGERGLERRESFGGRLRTRKLFLVQRHAAVEIQHRNQTAIKETALNRAGGAPLALQRQGVEVGAAYFFQGRDGIGAHTLVRLRVQ